MDTEIESPDTHIYTKALGNFVNVDYMTSDDKRKMAKGLLKDITKNHLIIYDLKNKDKFWRICVDSIINFHTEPIK